MGSTMTGFDGTLLAPERNHFFYGKLMDVGAFQKDAQYASWKRALVNRLALGSGVVCGLGVEADPAAAGRVRVLPGVAIDGRGREIVVAAPAPVDPHQLTDDAGEPTGAPLTTGVVSLSLTYAEAQADPVPVLVPDCDTKGYCAPGTVREGFRILVRTAEPTPAPPPACGLAEFPLPTDPLHTLLAARLAQGCPPGAGDPSIPVARVTLDDGSIDTASGRPLVYGNALLYELLLCLAARVDALTP
jgi:hypothetical protein